ncbi:30S ribosomal protein S9, partial [Candidatus Kuenenbacteria bacterium]|nr:30S ribosomal protein S9 [Candidatus Kuenenbacteria bacterium]
TGTYYYGLGRRKTSVARVRLFANGSGKLTVNGKDYKTFYSYPLYAQNLELPFEAVGLAGKVDADIKVIGGGLQSGSEACRLGIARALIKMTDSYKPALRSNGYVTRDPRAKERKKPGLKKARRAPQWAKR